MKCNKRFCKSCTQVYQHQRSIDRLYFNNRFGSTKCKLLVFCTMTKVIEVLLIVSRTHDTIRPNTGAGESVYSCTGLVLEPAHLWRQNFSAKGTPNSTAKPKLCQPCQQWVPFGQRLTGARLCSLQNGEKIYENMRKSLECNRYLFSQNLNWRRK